MLLAESLLGSSSAAPVYIEDVFSTYLYTGNSTTGGTQTITNGVDLSTKGGMVWIKGRGDPNHVLFDTARGAGTTASNNQAISSNLTTAEDLGASYDFLSAFNTTGFTVKQGGTTALTLGANYSGSPYVSWSFRKQPKFFDIVTYTGTGANRTIAHNLGSVPGCIIVKRTDSTAAWAVYHRSLANTQYMVLNTTAAAATGATYWNSTTPTSSVFSLGTSTDVNASGSTYVAYLFAHDAGGFGATGADNVISCGTFTTNASGVATVSLGYEPQWILTKRTDAASPWLMRDNMRGWTAPSGAAQNLRANVSDAENTSNPSGLYPTATGFSVDSAWVGATSAPFIYIAIRRGPMKTPTTGTSVFYPIAQTGNANNTSVGFSPDWTPLKVRNGVGNWFAYDRLRGLNASLSFNVTDAESTVTGVIDGWLMNGVDFGSSVGASDQIYVPCFRRAPGFFDVVCYTGTGSVGTESHNLGVAPELMIVKQRAGTAFGDWWVYSSSVGATKHLLMQTTNAATTSTGAWNNTSPTSTVFTRGTVLSVASATFVAYLFATVAGVSKVGSYTGTGTTNQINCGFTGGARFVLIKRTDSTGDWYVWDSARGIVAGNDPYLLLNSTAAEVTGTDYVDTYSAGFELSSTAPAAINANGGTFIFWAIA